MERFNEPDSKGGFYGNGKALGTADCDGLAESQRVERGERKPAPRIRIQGFFARIRIHDAGRARG